MIYWMLILALCEMVNGQAMGRGISKYTRGQSDPRKCLSFFTEYLNGIEAPDDCRLEGHCECGTQGRAQIDGTLIVSPFGVHSINCSYHPYGEHSLADIEQMQTEEVNDFKDGYTQHLDSHLGVWVSDLKSTVEKFDKNKVTYYGMTWNDDGSDYYSVMTAPCGGYYIEFLSEKATGIESSTFHKTEENRFDFKNFSHPEMDFRPIKVSRATTKMDEMIHFYTKIIEGSLIRNVTVDGVHIAWVKLNYAQDMVLQFVNRPETKSAKFTVKDLEDYVNGVHDKYVKSHSCGFDQFADHHWAYDGFNDKTESLSSVAKKLDAAGYKYRWFQISGQGSTQIYAFDPSGWTFQLDWSPGNDVPKKIASYSAACKSNDGCYGQGLCNDENVFTPF